MGPRIQPGHPSSQLLHPELAHRQVFPVQIRDLQLAAGRGLELRSQAHRLPVVEVEPRHREGGAGPRRLFLQTGGPALFVEGDHAVALRIAHLVGENGGPAALPAGLAEPLGQSLAVEDVVSQHQGRRLVLQEVSGDEKGLGYAFRTWLHRILEAQAPLAAVPQQPLEGGPVPGGGDHQDVSNPGLHEGRQGIVDHRLVVDREKLLADGPSHGSQAGARASGQNDSLSHDPILAAVPSRRRS